MKRMIKEKQILSTLSAKTLHAKLDNKNTIEGIFFSTNNYVKDVLISTSTQFVILGLVKFQQDSYYFRIMIQPQHISGKTKVIFSVSDESFESTPKYEKQKKNENKKPLISVIALAAIGVVAVFFVSSLIPDASEAELLNSPQIEEKQTEMLEGENPELELIPHIDMSNGPDTNAEESDPMHIANGMAYINDDNATTIPLKLGAEKTNNKGVNPCMGINDGESCTGVRPAVVPIPIKPPITGYEFPDWNIPDVPEDESGDEGDPLVFSMSDKPASTTRNWPEQHESFLTQFDLYDAGYNVTLSRTVNGMTFFLDLDGDGRLSNGTEWLFDQNENVYQILARPMIDSNQNGYFDWTDNLWSIAMVKDGDAYHHVDDLRIVAINWSNAEFSGKDMHGTGQYADCLYEGVYLYPECNAVSDQHFRILAYNENGIMMQGGEMIPTYGAAMGWLDMSGEG